MPITWPVMSTSGPPEFPGLMAASVCRKCWNCRPTSAAIRRADDSRGHRGLQAKRAADGQHPIAHLHAVGIAQLHGRQLAVHVDLDDRQVGFLVLAHQLRRIQRGIAVQLHLNLRGLLDHVIIRQNEALLVHDHPGTQAAFGFAARRWERRRSG